MTSYRTGDASDHNPAKKRASATTTRVLLSLNDWGFSSKFRSVSPTSQAPHQKKDTAALMSAAIHVNLLPHDFWASVHVGPGKQSFLVAIKRFFVG